MSDLKIRIQKEPEAKKAPYGGVYELQISMSHELLESQKCQTLRFVSKEPEAKKAPYGWKSTAWQSLRETVVQRERKREGGRGRERGERERGRKGERGCVCEREREGER